LSPADPPAGERPEGAERPDRSIEPETVAG
jgi:hypothetical protein